MTVPIRMLGVLTALLACGSLHAYEFRIRFVQRVGETDLPLASGDGGTYLFAQPASGTTIRVRLQLGVFDDNAGPAPTGGLLGWTAGVQSALEGGVFTRTPGRLLPFAACGSPQCNGQPLVDPFTSISGIDATVALQTLRWECEGPGRPAPLPVPVVRAVNSYVSVWEFSVLVSGAGPVRTSFAGNLYAASSWRQVGQAIPPDCSNPQAPVAGSVTFVPVPLAPIGFTCTLQSVLDNPCPPDFNWDGRVDSQDFFDFLGAFFVQAAPADFNSSGTVDSQDFFDFVAAFLTGCP